MIKKWNKICKGIAAPFHVAMKWGQYEIFLNHVATAVALKQKTNLFWTPEHVWTYFPPITKGFCCELKAFSTRPAKSSVCLTHLHVALSITPDSLYTWKHHQHKKDFQAHTGLTDRGHGHCPGLLISCAGKTEPINIKVGMLAAFVR